MYRSLYGCMYAYMCVDRMYQAGRSVVNHTGMNLSLHTHGKGEHWDAISS